MTRTRVIDLFSLHSCFLLPTASLTEIDFKDITLQMFIGVYRVFTGKSKCRDFQFWGIACYPQSM